ncbi:serine/threonine protein kinase [Neorhodopirellula pilleata]|uniref:non-specific serine/threonine protein kinase n=1 Tax=Neorhodopirellula pilleata TaxID=2714738 RepID=A0A5C6AVJ9_9BACT|nr:serine/threonine-protein kinase [Neorhodopirellula pilleata]TWU04055.1 Serine/threonine-protein kinase PrkC [Neorhodopirellula pilleata]
MIARFHYDDQSLMRLLHDNPDDDASDMQKHVESCDACQSKLETLSSGGLSWDAVNELMQQDDLSPATERSEPRSGIAEDVEGSRSSAATFLQPTDYVDSLGRFARFEIMEILGRGGMGIVMRGYDTALDRHCAVKVLAPELATSAAARKRFSREAKSAAAVVHPHVVPIQTVDEHDGLPYLVMPVVEGKSLQQRVESDGPLSVIETVRIAMQVAEGLAAAHSQGLVHRDIKPANILLENGVERVQITDFGLARAVDDASMTRSGVIAGTPQYMSPEQAHGDEIDHRSDLFSLGSLMYFMLTGHSPFRAETTMGVLNRIGNDEPRRLQAIKPEIPVWLSGIVTKLLSKSPADRFETAQEVAELLEDCLAHVQQPTNTPLPESVIPASAPQQIGRPPIGKFIAAGAFAFSLIFAGVLMVLELNKGTLTIESIVDDVPIRIMEGDDVVRKLVIGREGGKTRLHAGKYTLEIDDRDTSYAITDGVVMVKRGETVIAKVTYVEKDDRKYGPLAQQRLSSAVLEFNNLYSKDGKGRPQQPLTQGEITACLSWKRGNGELSDEVSAAIRTMLSTRERLVPPSWEITGGLVRHPSEHGIVQTWEVNLETNGLSKPISIRRSAIAPPDSMLKPNEHDGNNVGTTPISDMVDSFNKSWKERDDFESLTHRLLTHGLDLPPLTIDEVLAAIALWQSSRKTADVDDAIVQQLKRITETHQLPTDTKFELVPSIKDDIDQWYDISLIRMHVPQIDVPGSTYPVTIRQQFIETDDNNLSATHWGHAGSNGIQAGFRLLPPQQSYQHDQLVEVEFLYRSVTSKEISAKLPTDFRYQRVRMGTEVKFASTIDVQKQSGNGFTTANLGGEPTIAGRLRMQLCLDKAEERKEGVSLMAVVEPGKSYQLQFVVPNPGVDAAGEPLETKRSNYFSTPLLKPKQQQPLFTGHWYQHWGRSIPGHQFPDQSTPDPDYIDPFMIGMSLGKADASQIPGYFAGGLKVTKVAPHSPAEAAGIEVGDVLLSWSGHKIYGDDASANFLKYNLPNRELRELQEKMNKLGRWMGSGNIKFVMLDHRSGEVIDIAPWYGALAGGGPNKAEVIRRLQERKRLRDQ